MTAHQMPVLSEQEREVQISNTKALIEQITKDCAVGWTADRAYLLPLQIALAALTAAPVAFTEKHEISNMHATGLYLRAWPADRARNEVEGYTVGVYTMPPVPVKQEGEQP